jgi:hypothetical protein
LVRDPDLTTLSLTADPPSVEPGRAVGAVVTARTPDYQPAVRAQVRVDLFSVETQKVVASQMGSTGPDGTARLEFAPPEPGAYKLMEQIAKATGGRAFRLPMSSLPEIPLNDPPLVEVGRSRDRPLWDRWYYLLAMVALLGTEWMLRRRFGYI